MVFKQTEPPLTMPGGAALSVLQVLISAEN
jgi:hypothetical protein